MLLIESKNIGVFTNIYHRVLIDRDIRTKLSSAVGEVRAPLNL